MTQVGHERCAKLGCSRPFELSKKQSPLPHDAEDTTAYLRILPVDPTSCWYGQNMVEVKTHLRHTPCPSPLGNRHFQKVPQS